MKVYTTAELMIEDDGIYMPVNDIVSIGSEPVYKLVMTREIFVEAYNKWIRELEVPNDWLHRRAEL